MVLKLLYFVILALEIYGNLTENRTLVLVTKPLLMPLIAAIAYKSEIKDKLLYLALLFSFCGDVFLLFNGSSFFLSGLASFLIAHVFYILIFYKDYQKNRVTIFIFALLASSFIYFLLPYLNSFTIPVIVYCTVISFMGITAASRKKKPKSSFYLILIGALLFMISDSLIAINKFYAALDYPSLYIMSTYGLAQFLILQGLIKKDSL